MAANRREPILLRGFDRRRQFDISFQTIAFGAVWLRRIYTDEEADHITLRTRDNEFRLQEVRYGNNIAILFKACYHLRQYYDARDFWPAIARGFGASADVVRNMVELFSEARSIFRRNNPDEEDFTRSGANIAADRWLDFLANRRRDSHVGWETRDSQASSSEIFEHARAFYKNSEGKQVALAKVLPKKTDFHHYSTSESRKRFASHEPSDRPPSPKRRTDSNYLDRRDLLSSRIPRPLTPISTGKQMREPARQDYQTPISTSDRLPWVNSSSQASPEVASEVSPKIRGTASQIKHGLPASESRDLTPNHAPSNGSLIMESQDLRGKVASLEKEVHDLKSRLLNDQHNRNLVNKMLSEHGLIGIKQSPSTPDPAVKSMQAQIASLEAMIKEEAARHAQEIEGVKDSIQIAKQGIAMLRNSSVKKETLPSGHDQDVNPSLHALKMIQDKLGSIEDRLLVQGTAEAQTRLSALESGVAIIQQQTSEAGTQLSPKVNDRLTNIGNNALEIGAEEQDQVFSLDVLDKFSKLEDVVSSIANRVTKIEANPNEGEHVCELERRIQDIEQQRDNDRNGFVTKDSVRDMFEQLDNRLTQEKNAASQQFQDINLRLMATEIHTSSLLKTVDMLSPATRPSPSQDGQTILDEVFKKINTLPTEAYVTDMIIKREQVLKSENDKIRQSVDDLLTRISSLPTATLVSDMIDKRNEALKSDNDKLRRSLSDKSTDINSPPNKSYFSESLFRLEQSLRAELERYQKDKESVVDGIKKDLGTLQAQIKGLNKLWNEATTGIVKSDSLVELKLEIDALKRDVAMQSKKMNDPSQGLNKAQEDTIAALECRVVDLSTQVQTTLSDITLEKLVQRLQETPNKTGMQSATKDARVDKVILEIEKLHARDRMLAKILCDVGQLKQPV